MTFDMNIVSFGLSIISLIATCIFGVITIIISVSQKQIKNLMLIEFYTKHQSSIRGKNYLINKVILKKEYIPLDMYLGVDDFIDGLYISGKEKRKIKGDIKKMNIESEFGAKYRNKGNN